MGIAHAKGVAFPGIVLHTFTLGVPGQSRTRGVAGGAAHMGWESPVLGRSDIFLGVVHHTRLPAEFAAGRSDLYEPGRTVVSFESAEHHQGPSMGARDSLGNNRDRRPGGVSLDMVFPLARAGETVSRYFSFLKSTRLQMNICPSVPRLWIPVTGGYIDGNHADLIFG